MTCCRSSIHVAALLVTAVLCFAGEAKKGPYRPNKLDDWGVGFSDCLERHTNGCKSFVAQYRPQTKTAPEAFEYVVGTESPLRKVFKDKFMFHGRYAPEVHLYAARNEAEGVQVCVIPVEHEKALTDVKLTMSALVGPGYTIPIESIELSVVEYIQPEPVTYPVTYTGPWPDPLIPQGEMKVDVPPLELRPFWLEVRVPKEAAPGDYRGTLTVTVADSHGLSIPVNLYVWGFAVPDEIHMSITTGLNRHRFTVSGDPKEETEALHRYVEFFLKHRINVGPPCTVPMKDDPNYEKLDQELDWAIKRGMSSFYVRCNLKSEQRKKQFVDLCTHLREKGWLKYAVVHVGIDEPNLEHYPKVVEHAKAIKQLVPDVKTRTTESPHPDLIGHVDIFGSDVCTEREERNRTAREAGAHVFYSMCHIPVRAQFLRPQHEAPNMILDIPAVFHRVIFWMAWANNIDGLMFWGGNKEWPKGVAKVWPDQPWPPKDFRGNWVYSGLHNGNGVTVYPGRNGHPWASVRMKVIRDGSEDYEYLRLLRELLKKKPNEEAEKLLDPVPEICVTPTYFNHMPDAILDRRMKLGRAIDGLARRPLSRSAP